MAERSATRPMAGLAAAGAFARQLSRWVRPQQAWGRRRDADSRTGVRQVSRPEMQSETATSSAAPGNPVAQSRAVPRSRVAGAAHSSSSSSSVGGSECEQRGQRNYGAGAVAIVGEHGRQRWLLLNLNAGGTVGAGVCVSVSVSVCAARGGRAAGALGSQRGQAARARLDAAAAATAAAARGRLREGARGGRGDGCGVSVASSGTLVAGL